MLHLTDNLKFLLLLRDIVRDAPEVTAQSENSKEEPEHYLKKKLISESFSIIADPSYSMTRVGKQRLASRMRLLDICLCFFFQI